MFYKLFCLQLIMGNSPTVPFSSFFHKVASLSAFSMASITASAVKQYPSVSGIIAVDLSVIPRNDSYQNIAPRFAGSVKPTSSL